MCKKQHRADKLALNRYVCKLLNLPANHLGQTDNVTSYVTCSNTVNKDVAKPKAQNFLSTSVAAKIQETNKDYFVVIIICFIIFINVINFIVTILLLLSFLLLILNYCLQPSLVYSRMRLRSWHRTWKGSSLSIVNPGVSVIDHPMAGRNSLLLSWYSTCL